MLSLTDLFKLVSLAYLPPPQPPPPVVVNETETHTVFQVGSMDPSRKLSCPGVSVQGDLCLGWVSVRESPPTRQRPPSPLWTEWLTHGCDDIILSQTSFEGGKFHEPLRDLNSQPFWSPSYSFNHSTALSRVSRGTLKDGNGNQCTNLVKKHESFDSYELLQELFLSEAKRYFEMSDNFIHFTHSKMPRITKCLSYFKCFVH